MEPYRTLLVPTDFSQFTQLALDHAVALAQAFTSRIILLHVIPEETREVLMRTAAEGHLEQGERILESILEVSRLQLNALQVNLPEDRVKRLVRVGHPVIECLAKDENGLIYGGSSDGFLFSFDPAKKRLTNLGKARVSRRLRSLTIGKDQRVYLVAGERFEPCRLFRYNPQDGGFKDLGVIAVDRSPYYSWRGYQFDSMATGLDGTIYIGESERRSHLFLFIPW